MTVPDHFKVYVFLFGLEHIFDYKVEEVLEVLLNKNNPDRDKEGKYFTADIY